MGIKALRTHGKTSSLIKKVEANKSLSFLSKSFEASASNKVLHQETFTISSYQVKKAEILLALHSILTHTTQRTMEKYTKLTKVLFPESKMPEQLELRRTIRVNNLVQVSMDGPNVIWKKSRSNKGISRT